MTEGNGIEVRLARIEGLIDRITDKVEFGDRNTLQVVQLLGARLDNLAADQTDRTVIAKEERSEVLVLVKEAQANHHTSTAALRADIEGQVARIKADVDSLRLWRSKIMGGAAVVGFALGIVGGLVGKLIGG